MTPTQAYENSSIDRIFGVVLEKQTYKNIGYLLLSFPLGVVYFLIVVPGMVLSFPLMFLVIGFPLMLGVLLISDQLLSFERFLLRTVLNQPVFLERPRMSPEKRLFAHLGQRLAHRSTWKGLLYILLRFGMGPVSLALVVSLIPVSVILLTLPLTYQLGGIHLFGVTIDTSDKALLCSSLGAVLVLASAHIFNAWTGLWKRVAGALLR